MDRCAVASHGFFTSAWLAGKSSVLGEIGCSLSEPPEVEHVNGLGWIVGGRCLLEILVADGTARHFERKLLGRDWKLGVVDGLFCWMMFKMSTFCARFYISRVGRKMVVDTLGLRSSATRRAADTQERLTLWNGDSYSSRYHRYDIFCMSSRIP